MAVLRAAIHVAVLTASSFPFSFWLAALRGTNV